MKRVLSFAFGLLAALTAADAQKLDPIQWTSNLGHHQSPRRFVSSPASQSDVSKKAGTSIR